MNGSAAVAGADVQTRTRIMMAFPCMPLQPRTETIRAVAGRNAAQLNRLCEEDTCRRDGTNFKFSNAAIATAVNNVQLALFNGLDAAR